MYMKSRKSLPLRGCALIMAIFMMGAGLTGCKKTQEEASTDIPPAPKSTQTMTYSGKEPVGFQFEQPAKGEEIAVLHTEKGDIRLRLFPDKAPNAVNNFKALIKVGYYDGITFHRVIDDFMIQGGDPTGTGSGGKSIWGTDFGYEFNTNLLHFRGALSMAHSQLAASNASQFFIVNARPAGEAAIRQTLSQYGQHGYDTSQVTDEIIKLYGEKGGTPWLDGIMNSEGHTVFGQAFADDMDVVDAIAATENTGETVKITRAELVKYEG